MPGGNTSTARGSQIFEMSLKSVYVVSGAATSAKASRRRRQQRRRRKIPLIEKYTHLTFNTIWIRSIAPLHRLFLRCSFVFSFFNHY